MLFSIDVQCFVWYWYFIGWNLFHCRQIRPVKFRIVSSTVLVQYLFLIVHVCRIFGSGRIRALLYVFDQILLSQLYKIWVQYVLYILAYHLFIILYFVHYKSDIILCTTNMYYNYIRYVYNPLFGWSTTRISFFISMHTYLVIYAVDPDRYFVEF